jgi:hypothetical protein
MIRITVFDHTGSRAINLKIAQRIARKVRGAVRKGTCVLIDWEGIETISPGFFAELIATKREDKVKFCGLPISVQIELRPSPPNAGCN